MAVVRTEPPLPPNATAADSLDVGQVSMGARFRYSVGSVGVALIAGTIRRNVMETESTLAGMGKAITESKGSDGMRAREIARKIKYADSLAVEHLYYGRPINAVRQTMEAKSLLNAVRTNLRQQI